jgi:hypothetical protein
MATAVIVQGFMVHESVVVGVNQANENPPTGYNERQSCSSRKTGPEELDIGNFEGEMLGSNNECVISSLVVAR